MAALLVLAALGAMVAVTPVALGREMASRRGMLLSVSRYWFDAAAVSLGASVLALMLLLQA